MDFHADDEDKTAFLSADLDRLRWAHGAAVADGETEPDDAIQKALSEFIDRTGDHEISALARVALAEILRPKNPSEARTVALEAVERHPQSVGAKQCHNLIAQIESKELAVATERTLGQALAGTPCHLSQHQSHTSATREGGLGTATA